MNRPLPVRARGVTGAISIAAGERQSCAALSTGRVLCWGANVDGNLGVGDVNERLNAVEVVGLTTAQRVVSEGGATCAVLGDSTVRCWGANGYGETGTDMGEWNVPTAAPPVGVGPVSDIALGRRFACAIERDGRVLCWGSHYDGQWGELLPSGIFRTPQLVTLPLSATRTFAGRWFVASDDRVAEGAGILADLRAVEMADGACARTREGAVLCAGIAGERFERAPPP